MSEDETPEPVSQEAQQLHFSRALDGIIEKHMDEYDLTAESFVGGLIIKAIKIAMQEIEDEEDLMDEADVEWSDDDDDYEDWMG